MKQIASGKVDINVSTAPGQVGEMVTFDGTKVYRLAKVKDLAVAAGNVVEYSSSASASLLAVTKDRAGGTSIGRSVAGVAAGTVTADYYGYVQVDGEVSVTVPAGVAVAAGNLLVAHATSDGGVNVATTSTNKNAFAVALSADTATTSAAGACTAKLFRI